MKENKNKFKKKTYSAGTLKMSESETSEINFFQLMLGKNSFITDINFEKTNNKKNKHQDMRFALWERDKEQPSKFYIACVSNDVEVLREKNSDALLLSTNFIDGKEDVLEKE